MSDITFSTEFELLELEPKIVSLDQLYLDPNNPRLIESYPEIVPDSRITEESVQRTVLNDIINRIGISDLIESIKRNGFLKTDRIVVRPIDYEKFVVIEGNRRVAALKILDEEHKRGRITLHEKVLKSIREIEVLVYNGTRRDIAWIIQGLRHLTGIKEWPKLQRSKFVTENFYERRNMTFGQIGRLIGMPPTTVGYMVRAYYGFKQAKEDEEYGEYIKQDKYSMFEEAVFRRASLKRWLGWNDRTMRFTNMENFKKFLSWITPNENDEIRIQRAIDVRDILSKLVLEENKDILERFENGEISIREAQAEIERRRNVERIERESIDVNKTLKEVERFYIRLSSLPMPQILSNQDAVIKLRELFNKIKEVISIYEPLLENQG